MLLSNAHTHTLPVLGKEVAICQGSAIIADNNFYSVGIHPWHINLKDIESEKANILKTLGNSGIKAIGECGLDKKISSDLRTQNEVFEWHIQQSYRHNKPLIIHCVKAYNEILNIKKNNAKSPVWIIHGFNSSIEMAYQLIDSGCILSLGHHTLLNNKLQNLVKELDEHVYLIESDTKDYPILKNIYETIAHLKNTEIETLALIKLKLFKNIFQIADL